MGAEASEATAIMKETEENEDLMRGLIDAAKEVAGIVGDDMVLQGIRTTFMADYIESLAAWAVGGDGEEVGRFIVDCLRVENAEVEYNGKPVMVEGDVLGGGGGEL